MPLFKGGFAEGFVPSFEFDDGARSIQGLGDYSDVFDQDTYDGRELNIKYLSSSNTSGPKLFRNLLNEIIRAAEQGNPYTDIQAGSVIGPRVPSVLVKAKRILDNRRSIGKNIPFMKLDGILSPPARLIEKLAGKKKDQKRGGLREVGLNEYNKGDQKELLQALKILKLDPKSHQMLDLQNIPYFRKYAEGFIPNFMGDSPEKRQSKIQENVQQLTSQANLLPSSAKTAAMAAIEDYEKNPKQLRGTKAVVEQAKKLFDASQSIEKGKRYNSARHMAQVFDMSVDQVYRNFNGQAISRGSDSSTENKSGGVYGYFSKYMSREIGNVQGELSATDNIREMMKSAKDYEAAIRILFGGGEDPGHQAPIDYPVGFSRAGEDWKRFAEGASEDSNMEVLNSTGSTNRLVDAHYSSGHQKDKPGSMARKYISFTKAQEVINTVRSAAGAKSVNNVQFPLSDSKFAEIRGSGSERAEDSSVNLFDSNGKLMEGYAQTKKDGHKTAEMQKEIDKLLTKPRQNLNSKAPAQRKKAETVFKTIAKLNANVGYQADVFNYQNFLKASSGYIPNYSKALSDAVNREKDALKSQGSQAKVYVGQDNRVKGPMNPKSLLVANTRG